MTALVDDVVAHHLAGLRDVRVHRRGDAGLEPAACSMNTDVAATPAAVVECGSSAAVAAVVAAAKAGGIPLAVRGGGYSVAGSGTVDDGLVLSVAPLKGIHVDDATGLVRVGAGVTAGELERALEPHGLALDLPVPSETSVVGTALSGGVGFTLRRTGFLCDALVSAALVDGAGERLRVDDDSAPELMRALRGGGGNFGVVTEACFQATRVSAFTVTQRFYPLAAMADRLCSLREWARSDPSPDLTVVAMALPLPPLPTVPSTAHGRPALLVTTVHCGPEAVAARDGAAVLAGPRPLADRAVRVSPRGLRDIMDAAHPHSRFGVRARSGWVDALPDPTIDQLSAAAAALPPSGSLLELAVLGAAVGRPERPGVMPGRTAAFFGNAMAIWHDEREERDALRWLASTDGLRRDLYSGPALVPGFASADELDRAGTTFGAELALLRAVKRRHDPDDLFRHTLRIDASEVDRG